MVGADLSTFLAYPLEPLHVERSAGRVSRVRLRSRWLIRVASVRSARNASAMGASSFAFRGRTKRAGNKKAAITSGDGRLSRSRGDTVRGSRLAHPGLRPMAPYRLQAGCRTLAGHS